MSVPISVIIPIYNGALYLEQTLRSLLNQTFSDFEIICVDDESTDSSLEILNSIAEKDKRVKVFTKPNGGTAAKALNYGLQFALGDYFMYSSQDDLFSNDLLEKNFLKAKSLKADAVVPEMVLYSGDCQNASYINKIRSEVITGREAFILSLDWRIHGFALWNMKMVRKIGFYDFGLNSDEFTTRMLFFNSKRVVFSEGKFYYRQNNANAITKKWNIKQLDFFETSTRIENFLIQNNFNEDTILRVHRTILIDLIRIRLLYLNNIKNIESLERDQVKKALKMIYNNNRAKIKSVKPLGPKQLITNKIITLGFSYYLAYTYLYNKYLQIINAK